MGVAEALRRHAVPPQVRGNLRAPRDKVFDLVSDGVKKLFGAPPAWPGLPCHQQRRGAMHMGALACVLHVGHGTTCRPGVL
jgi:hypothetical protein